MQGFKALMLEHSQIEISAIYCVQTKIDEYNQAKDITSVGSPINDAEIRLGTC